MSTNTQKPTFISRLAHGIVFWRQIILILCLALVVFSVIAIPWVEVDESFTSYLDAESETRRGISIMEEEFATYATAQIMVDDVSPNEAQAYADRIGTIDGVAMVTFDFTDHHYSDRHALYDVSFSAGAGDEIAKTAYNNVRALFDGKTIHVSSDIGTSMNVYLLKEMAGIGLIVAAVVVAVLIFTSQTYAEVAVLVLTFLFAAILQQGTNFILGRISFVSNAVTMVLQLALSVDYAIIFCNRYKEEHENLAVRPAVEAALAKSIPEILSSSLTTIAGLTAMTFMKFRLGADLGFVLIKAIACSLLSVFFFMPAMLVAFGKAMDRTRHRSFVPKIPFVGKFAYRTRFVVPIVFLAVFIGAFAVYRNVDFAYSNTVLSAPRKNEAQIQEKAIRDRFGESNTLAVIVPSGDYEKEQALLKELGACPEVKNTMGLASIDAMGGYKLGDSVTAAEFAELADLDDTAAKALFLFYAGAHGEQTAATEAPDTYRAPILDLFLFLHDHADSGDLPLEDAQKEMINELYSQLDFAREQLQGKRYSRMLLTLGVPIEGKETFAFLDRVHVIAEQYYPADQIVTVGQSTNSYDFQRSFEQDNLVVTLLSMLLVTIILLLTFRSVGMPVLLILVIQGSICLNFAFTKLAGSYVFFFCYLIVTAIQMGANIDYAIVISSRFRQLRETMTPRQSIIETMNLAFPTVITSGTMMVVAGLLIGFMVSEPIIAGIGRYVGTGTIITLVLVMFVLPQLLLFGEDFVQLTALPSATTPRARRKRRRAAALILTAAGILALVAAPLTYVQAKRAHDAGTERTAAITKELDTLSELAERLDADLTSYQDTAFAFAEHAVTETVGAQKLSEGEAQISQGEAKLQQGEAELRQGEARYQAGAAQLKDAKAQYAAGQAELEAGRAAYDEGQRTLDAAKAEYAAGEQRLQQVKPIYDIVYPLYQNYLNTQAQYDAAIAAGDMTQAGRLAMLVATQRTAFETKLAGSGYSIASLVQEYQAGLQQLENGAAQITAGEQKLKEAQQQLADGQAQLDVAAAQIAAGEQELNAGKAKLDSGKAELNSGKAKLNAAKGELAAGRETLDENREALSADLESLDAYTDDSERLRAGMERLMQEEGISARAGKDATNAAVISAARQEVRAEQEAADSEAQRKTVQCALLLLAGLLSLIAVVLILMRSSAGFPLLVAAFPSALAAALISSPLKAPLLFAAALAVIIALAFGTLTYRKKNA